MLGVEQGSWITAGLVGVVLVLVYRAYFKSNRDFWKSRGIKFVQHKSFFSTIYQFLKKPIHEIEVERYVKYGKIYGHFEGSKPFLSVANPALLRDVLVKDFPTFPSRRVFSTGDATADSILIVMKGGEDWKRIRSIVTPTFSTGKIRRMLSILKDSSKTVVENFKKSSKNGETIDAKRMFGAFTMDVIASTAFSTKIDSHNDPDNPFVAAAKDVFNVKVNWRVILLLLCPKLVQYFKIPVLFPHAISFFRKVTFQIMEERKRTGQTRNDFLQLLIDTAKEVEEDQKLDHQDNGDIASNYNVQDDINPQIFKNVTSKNLSMEELVAQCVTFFIAGYDTTATTLGLASYELALNPSVQDAARREVDDTLKETGGELTYEAVQNMKYLDNVISETLRKYPPVVRLERTCETAYELGDTGLTLPKEVAVTIPVWAMHRDPEIFPNPETFDPERFSPEQRAKRDAFTYMPFGLGPRSCVAMRFALVEMKVCLAHVLAHFIIKTCPDTKIPLDFNSGQGTLQPIGNILKMELRENPTMIH
ncbi:hypothetical protein JTE90_018707 [Oedothorax gibbosus]|uniref:Cytochrome P450 n=1 Tax=Oedothorax gibbosus TaxID=931172 RepID=A0AAV6TYR7_9ARAC|nr:hypothetical protein JTE90_018707 [Oedothorax gibbosus]